LRERVERLLQGAETPDGFLGSPTAGAIRTAEANEQRGEIGTCIGPYRLLELIGEGGFGSIYLAEQTESIRRRVALKIIKVGMDTRAAVARFEQERQSLALMDHPNIAKVYDVGSTDSGRPYFVMELVFGEPVTAFCDRTGLTVA